MAIREHNVRRPDEVLQRLTRHVQPVRRWTLSSISAAAPATSAPSGISRLARLHGRDVEHRPRWCLHRGLRRNRLLWSPPSITSSLILRSDEPHRTLMRAGLTSSVCAARNPLARNQVKEGKYTGHDRIVE